MNKLEAARLCAQFKGSCSKIPLRCNECFMVLEECGGIYDTGTILMSAKEYIQKHQEEQAETKRMRVKSLKDIKKIIKVGGSEWSVLMDKLCGKTLEFAQVKDDAWFDYRETTTNFRFCKEWLEPVEEAGESTTFDDSAIENVEKPQAPAKNANAKTLRAFISQWEKYSNHVEECNGWLKRDVEAVEINLESYPEKLREAEQERDLLAIAANRDKALMEKKDSAYAKLVKENKELKRLLNEERAEHGVLKEEFKDKSEEYLILWTERNKLKSELGLVNETVKNMAVKLHGGE